MKNKNDIGQLINSKLKNKYTDDFFDESKSWNLVMDKLPKRGFWNWGIKHVNIYYVTLSFLLIWLLIDVSIDSKQNESKNTTYSISDTIKENAPNDPAGHTLDKGKKTLDLHSKNHSGEKQASSKAADQIIPVDSGLSLEKENKEPDIAPDPSSIQQSAEQALQKHPQKEINTPDQSLLTPPTSVDTSKKTKDILRNTPATLKKDTIRRTIKRFD